MSQNIVSTDPFLKVPESFRFYANYLLKIFAFCSEMGNSELSMDYVQQIFTHLGLKPNRDFSCDSIELKSFIGY